MDGRGGATHGCSYPGCDKKVTHDLRLSKRTYVTRTRAYYRDGKPAETCEYKALSSNLVDHIYLCDEHAEDMVTRMAKYKEDADAD